MPMNSKSNAAAPTPNRASCVWNTAANADNASIV